MADLLAVFKLEGRLTAMKTGFTRLLTQVLSHLTLIALPRLTLSLKA